MIPFTKNEAILLLFKDSPSKTKEGGFPLAMKSTTIRDHIAIASAARNELGTQKDKDSKREIEIFPNKNDVAFSTGYDADNITDGCCVWGWWKKPWEQNFDLFKRLEHAIKNEGVKPEVILYHQYLRTAYRATLHGLHYLQYADTVELPEKWDRACPEAYSLIPHLCGAFFQLSIITTDKGEAITHTPSDLFKKYYIDIESFPILKPGFQSLIKPNQWVESVSRSLVDQRPGARSLKDSDHSLFVLRDHSQKEKLLKAFKDESTDHQVKTVVDATSWRDIYDILTELDMEVWKKLASSYPSTINAISVKSNGSVSEYDIYLVASAITCNELRCIFDHDNSSKIPAETARNLILWLLEEDSLKKREVAANFFSASWKTLMERYGFHDISEYFESLPGFEGIAYTTQHGFIRKFYRDHLNHNIRAALCAAAVALQSDYYNKIQKKHEGINITLIAFLSGLLHDIAYPLASFGKTEIAILEALKKLKLTEDSSSLFSLSYSNRNKDVLGLACLLTSLPNILDTYDNIDPILPYSNRSVSFETINPGLLFQSVTSTEAKDHAPLAAAALLEALSLEDRKSLFNFGKLKGSPGKAVEILSLIQNVVLHDRRASQKWYGSGRMNPKEVVHLSTSSHPMGVLTIITDELQEWGRPISDYSKSLVRNCKIGLTENRVSAYYELDFSTNAASNVPYSMLEHFYSKRSTFQGLYHEKEAPLGLALDIEINSDKLSPILHNVSHAGVSFVHRLNTEVAINFIEEEKQALLIFISRSSMDAGRERRTSRDFMILNHSKDENAKIVLDHLRDNPSLTRIIFDEGDACVIETNDLKIIATVKNYQFGFVKKDEISIEENFKQMIEEGQHYSACMELELKDVESKGIEQVDSNEKKFRAVRDSTNPHFIDADWRFTYQSVESVWRFLKSNILPDELGENYKIAYLGCPSLAVYQAVVIEDMNFQLIDKGHAGIERIIEHPDFPAQNFLQHNVGTPLSEKLKRCYDLVIMDPPWYHGEYMAFWYCALSLIKKGGVLGVVEYPGYDHGKLKKLNDARAEIIRSTHKRQFYASVAISYDIPEFEKSWNGQKDFFHSAAGVYRPTYMDFYRISTPLLRSNLEVSSAQYPQLGKSFYSDRDYILYAQDKITDVCGQRVLCKTRENLDRKIKFDKSTIALSTRNTEVKTSTAKNSVVIDSLEDLEGVVLKFEQRTLR